MTRSNHEAEPPCNECKAFAAAGKRGMQQFADGKSYFVTGACKNAESPLYGRDLAGAHTASTNAVHHRVANMTARLTCFQPIPR